MSADGVAPDTVLFGTRTGGGTDVLLLTADSGLIDELDVDELAGAGVWWLS